MRSLGKCVILSVGLLFLLGVVVSYADPQDGQPWMRDRDPLNFGGTLTLARGWEPLSLDSLRTTYGDQPHMYISEPPFIYGPNGEFGPGGWVESVENSSDGLVWTFCIKARGYLS